MAAAAIGQMTVAMVGYGLVCLWDTPRRYPGFRYSFAVTPFKERREAASLAIGYWLQSAPNTLITFIPIFLLSAASGATVVVAQFVLIRTVGNVVRQALQMFATVLGQEASRRFAKADQPALENAYLASGRLLAVQSACAAGVVVALAPQLFAQWTARPELYDPVLLFLTILPPLMMPSLALAQTFLASANRPFSMSLGRLLQVVLTIVLYYLLPIENDAWRMMAAIGVGELAGFGFPVERTISGLVPAANFRYRARLVGISFLSVSLTAAATFGGAYLAGSSQILQIVVGLCTAAPVCLALFVFFVLGLPRSRAVLNAVIGTALQYMRHDRR